MTRLLFLLGALVLLPLPARAGINGAGDIHVSGGGSFGVVDGSSIVAYRRGLGLGIGARFNFVFGADRPGTFGLGMFTGLDVVVGSLHQANDPAPAPYASGKVDGGLVAAYGLGEGRRVSLRAGFLFLTDSTLIVGGATNHFGTTLRAGFDTSLFGVDAGFGFASKDAHSILYFLASARTKPSSTTWGFVYGLELRRGWLPGGGQSALSQLAFTLGFGI